ncbi:MAG: hypothetical protein Q8K75_03255 [Chlamydiales bacterium]|nr:hypothetical protein [Chlamydiales bacterium]
MKHTLSILLITIFSTVNAFDIDINLWTGYRQDEVSARIDAFDPPGTFIVSNHVEGKDIQLVEFGATAQARIVSNWWLHGAASVGSINKGKYSETSATFTSESVTKADIYKGDSFDYSVSVGYLIPTTFYSVTLEPVIGWSYDTMRFKIKNAAADNTPEPTLDGLTYMNKWDGMWLGLIAYYSVGPINIKAGYEYHRPRWHAQWTLAGPDIPEGAFSDKRKATRAWGNVFFVDTNYLIQDNWDAGLGLKYGLWQARDGYEHPKAGSFPDVGYSAEEQDQVPFANWKSFQVRFTSNFYY